MDVRSILWTAVVLAGMVVYMVEAMLAFQAFMLAVDGRAIGEHDPGRSHGYLARN